MKTVILPIPMGHLVKNILRTGVFEYLRKSNIRIILLTYESNHQEFAREYGSDNVIIENMYPYNSGFFEVFCGGIADRVYKNSIDNVTLRIIEDARLLNKKLTDYFKIRVIGKIVDRNRPLMNLMEHIYMHYFKNGIYNELFEKYHPDLYFSTDPYNTDELPLLRKCLDTATPIVAMIRSWDNVTNHGKLPMKFEKIVVWNEILRDELIRFYDYSPDAIFLSGTPQYDYYCGYKPTQRINFFREIGGDPEKKLVTFATVPPLISPKEQENLEMLCESIKNGELGYPAQLLIRFHPQDDPERYSNLEKYRGDGNFIFESAGRESSAYYDKWSPTKDDMIHYADILTYSDVIINVASTVSIEAAIFDTPVVNIKYDGRENIAFPLSAARHYDFLHYRSIVSTRGVRLADSHEDLIEWIKQYLDNPDMDRQGRERIVKTQCYRFDGRAGERIARYIVQCVSNYV